MKLLTALLCVFAISLFAQESEYDFNIKENRLDKDPYDLSIRLVPSFTDLSKDNSVAGYAPSLFLRVGELMAIEGEYMGSYYNVIPDIEKSNTTAPTYNGVVNGEYVPFQYYKGGITLYVFSEAFEGKVKLGLPSEQRNGVKQRYFLEIDDVEKQRQVGIRITGGQYQGQIAEKNDEFEGVDPDPANIIAPLTNDGGMNYSSIKYNLFSAGVTFEQINHLKVNVKTDSLGIRTKRNHWKIYLDFLLAQQMEIGDILYTWDETGTRNEEVYELQKYTIPDLEVDVVPYLGYRAGFEFNSTGFLGYTYGVEIGARPGMGSIINRSYFAAKVGASLNFKFKKNR